MDNLTPAEVVARWGQSSVGTLANWRTLGTGPAYIKLGGRVYYPLAHLVQWETEHTHFAAKGKRGG